MCDAGGHAAPQGSGVTGGWLRATQAPDARKRVPTIGGALRRADGPLASETGARTLCTGR
jgi:hypothetical protein